MAQIQNWLTRSKQQGQGLVEYALILVLVSVISIIVLAALGTQVQETFCDVLFSLGENAPNVEACEAPRVTCGGLSNGATVASPVFMEAIVRDNKGPENIQQVEFFVDGARVRTEYQYQYCLGGTDDCSQGQSIGAGQHTIRAVALDADGYEGACEVTVTVTGG